MPSRRPLSTTDRLVAAYLPLARRIAADYCRRLPSRVALHDDIESAALYGLVQAAQRFDGAKGGFPDFAKRRISGAIGDALRDEDILSRDARARQKRERPDARPTVFGGALARKLMGAEHDEEGRVSRPVVWTEPDQDDAAHRGQLRRLLTAAIQRLPERSQRALQLRYVDGLTLAEVGRILGVTEPAVWQIEGRALVMLREMLGAG